MPIHSSDILFFFGAGASAEFGIPTMRKMAEDFQNLLNWQKDSTEVQGIYREIIRNLTTEEKASIRRYY
jgi:NAD-dependent SIR2 family protein deacetylase